ncbi:ribbon-helix-helix domain-containing protein [Microbacterium sp.]|uniref:ribbon-helix-helix domain-containing protein n=1 Tax=Microbacterium sp. TaxID=51671 RepID=UPI0039E6A0BB
MSIQIAVRLPDDTVARLDELVASGDAPSRTALVSTAIERELRRRAAERDRAILERVGASDDLDPLVVWATSQPQVEDDDA